jgi:hypothetical protein
MDADAAKKAAIAAAMERARAQREAAAPKNTDNLTLRSRRTSPPSMHCANRPALSHH